MPKQIQITIPKPCHENWEEMTPVQQGAYCKACQKNVIDFTRKTENEIYDIVTNAEGELCGRFTSFHLQQPIRKTEVNNGWFNWRAIAASLAAMVATGEIANAQDKNEQKQSEIKSLPQLNVVGLRHYDRQVLGGISIEVPINAGLKGKVIDAQTKEPLYMARVSLKSAGQGVLTDTSGNFQLIADANVHKNDIVVIQYVGYAIREIPVADFIKSGATGIIEIQLNAQVLGGMDVIVVNSTKMGKFKKSYWRRQERKNRNKN